MINNSSEDDILFGEWLNEQILARNWTQAELSRRSGISRGTINKIIEREVKRPFLSTCKKIARALGLPEAVVLKRAGWDFAQTSEEELSPEVAEINRIFKSLSPRSKKALLEIAATLQKFDT